MNFISINLKNSFLWDNRSIILNLYGLLIDYNISYPNKKNYLDDVQRKTALHYAVQEGRLETVKILMGKIHFRHSYLSNIKN